VSKDREGEEKEKKGGKGVLRRFPLHAVGDKTRKGKENPRLGILILSSNFFYS